MARSNLAVTHRAAAERGGDRPALRSRQGGVTRDLSWADYRRRADHAAAAWIALGFGQDDRVGLIAENRVDWLVADVALLSVGAANVSMHSPLAPPQVEYQLAHSEARALIVSGQEQADKVLARLPALPRLDLLVSFDPIDSGGRVPTLTWTELEERGARLGPAGLETVRRREEELSLGTLATLIYTSGTTGPPKGVMLSHGNLLSNAASVNEMLQLGQDQVSLSWLPFSHIYARTMDHYLAFLTGGVLYISESLDTVLADLAVAQPTVMNAVPRFYEKVWAAVEALPPEERRKRLHALFGPRLRELFSGGAPLPRHIAEGFHASGVMLLEGYGLTESSPTISFNRAGKHKFGTVGQAIPGVEIRIADDGEVLTKGPHVMVGYWRDPEATARAIVDGWLHTGDLGRLDDEGYLTITGRKKDLIITSGGKNISPNELEQLLTSDPLIDQAVVYGDAKPFPTALIVPNVVALEGEARKLGASLAADADGFVTDPAVLALLQEHVDRLMEVVSKPERVKAVVVLARPFTVEDDELTPTRKVRRARILEKHRVRLDALYAKRGPE
ncbi:MAG: AMP-dependent synthetase/ligase [Isosphaeraceae bacterium]|nr:AMP-dependent synthetase/ligase [Isosphaeraceae bacterium]